MNGKKISMLLLWVLFCIWKVVAQDCQPFNIDLKTSIPVTITETDSFIYWNVCKGQTLTFTPEGDYYNNNQYYNQSDATTKFYWNIKGPQSVEGEHRQATVSFNDVRGWDVSVWAVDVQGCPSDTIVGRIRVAGNPIRAIPSMPDICQGSEVDFCVGFDFTSAFIIDTVQSYVSGELGVSDPTFLPDGSGVSYTSDVNYDIFYPGQTLSTLSDLIRVKVSLEHSYLGDLSVRLSCPNGSLVQLFGQGGSTTLLGEPSGCGFMTGGVDDCTASANSALMGTTYDYYWSPTSTNGTIHNTWNWGNPSYFWDAAVTPMVRRQTTAVNHVLPDIEFQATGDWNALIGCPLNGRWTIQVTDHIGADNGWISEWSLELNPNIIPGGWGYVVAVDHIEAQGYNVTSISPECLHIRADSAGTFTYDLFIVDEYNCRWDTTFVVTVAPAAFPDLGPDFNICDGGSTVLRANVNSSTATYWWNTGRTTDSILVISPGTYIVKLTDYNQDSTLVCTNSDTITIGLNVKPKISFEADQEEGCAPLKVKFNNMTIPTEGELSFLWNIYDLNWNLVFSSSLVNPEVTLSNPGDYNVQLLVSTPEGCTDTLMRWSYLKVHPQPYAEFSAHPEESMLSDGGEIYFRNYSDSSYATMPGVRWYWDFGDGTIDSSEFSPTHTYSDWGDYDVKLFISTEHGCEDEIVHRVVIEADLEFPNVITPNGDGYNDVYAIKNLNTNINHEDPDKYRTNSLHIYDRWGKRVYHAENYDTYMKGEEIVVGERYFDGSNLSDGVYFYAFYYKGKVKEVKYHGSLSIVREN